MAHGGFLFTDVPTGFCAGGRNVAMRPWGCARWRPGCFRWPFHGRVPRPVRCPAHMHRGVRPSAPHARLFGLWAPVSLALYGPQLSGHHVTPQREMLAALGLVLREGMFLPWGVVCLLAAWRVYAQREGRALALGPSVAASGALYLHAVLRFIDARPACTMYSPRQRCCAPVCGFVFCRPAARCRA